MARHTLDQLLREFDPPVVRAALLRHYLAAHPRVEHVLAPQALVRRCLDDPSADLVAQATERLTASHPTSQEPPSLKQLELACERLIAPAQRRRQGVVYTPEHLVDYLLTTSLSQVPTERPRVLDPACGSGGFLIRAAWHIARRAQIPFAEAALHHTLGIDADPLALLQAGCLLELQAASVGERLDGQQLRLLKADALLTPADKLLERLDSPSGADVVATNPPYVKLQSLELGYREQLLTRYADVARSSFSLAPLFLLAGLELLAPQGTLAYLTQNNLFTSLAAVEIRRRLQQRRCVRRIIDFGHYRVFPGALAYTCLLFANRREHAAIEFARFERSVSLAELEQARFERVPTDSLQASKWRLASTRDASNLRAIEAIGTPLGKLCEIRVGFATLKDKVFFVDPVRLAPDDHRPSLPAGPRWCLAVHPETGQEYQIEAALTRPALRVADVADPNGAAATNGAATTNGAADGAAKQIDNAHESCDPHSPLDAAARRVIFPYRRVAGQWQTLDEATLEREFPQALAYLRDCRHLLAERDRGRRRYEVWYAWGRHQSRDAPGPKLLTKTFNARPCFFLDPSDRLFCNGYCVRLRTPVGTAEPLSLAALRVVLNSRVMHYYTKLTSFQIEGNYQCYQKNFIERFGIPALSAAEQRQLLTLPQAESDALLWKKYGLSDPGAQMAT